MEIVQRVKKLNSILRSNFRRWPYLFVYNFIETLCKRAISVAHLTDFSFEFCFEIFTKDVSLPLLYRCTKSQKWPKTQIKGVLPAFGHSPARHLQETKSHKTFSWNKGNQSSFTPFRPLTISGSVCFSNRAPLIWKFLPQPIRTCTSYTFFKSHFLDLILKSRNILVLALYNTNIWNPFKMGVDITTFVFPSLSLSYCLFKKTILICWACYVK